MAWQKEHCKDFQSGSIQNSKEYYEFLSYQRGNAAIAEFEPDEIRIRDQNPAIACGHKLHPLDIIAGGYCPIREVDICLEFLSAIRRVIQRCGGPWRQACRLKEYRLVPRCWHMARSELTRIASLLEIATNYEEKWERENPKDAGRFGPLTVLRRPRGKLKCNTNTPR